MLNRTGDKIQSVWDALQLKDVENYQTEQKECMDQNIRDKEKMNRIL